MTPRDLARISFALSLTALGVLGLVYRDFALQWQPVPASVPARQTLAIASAALLLAMGVGLIVRQTILLATRVCFVYALLWLVLLKLPAVVARPMVEVNWLGAGEITTILCAAWMLVAFSHGTGTGFIASARGRRVATLLFGLALIPIGLSHFVYASATLGFVPAWLPFRSFWANLGGAGHIAAGLGVLFGVYARLAARLEAAMVGVFTILVWGPRIVAAPDDRLQWTGFVISWMVAAAAWVVAESIAVNTRSGSAIDVAVQAPADAGVREKDKVAIES